MNSENNKKKPARSRGVRIVAILLVIVLVSQTFISAQTRVTYSSSEYAGQLEEHAAGLLADENDYLNGSLLDKNMTFLQQLSRSRQGYLSGASVAIGKKEYDTAIEFLEKAISVTDSSEREALGEMYLQKGSLEILTGAYEAAEKSLTSCVSYLPKEANAYYLRAQVSMVLGKTEDAVADVLKYEELAEEDPEIEASFGQLYEAAGDYKKAEACYTITLETPELYDMEALVNRARCRIYQENSEGAREDLERYLEEGGADEEYQAATMLCAVYLEAQEYEKAIQIYEDACSKGLEASAELKNWVGMAYMGVENFEAASGLFREVLDKEPEHESTAYYLALSEYSLEDYQSAMEAFTLAIENGEELQFCYYYRAVCCLQLGMIQAAEADLKVVLTMEGDETLIDSANEMLEVMHSTAG